jgi:hypothetical protein
MHKPRLYDPRSGHRIDSVRHRQLLRYADRQILKYDALADDAHQHMERMRRRSAQVKWARQTDRALSRLSYWREFKQVLEDQLKLRVEYEAKFAYTGKKKEHDRDRANLNIRMRFYGRPPLPTDREVKVAYYNLLLNGKPPKGWEYAVCDWRNDRLSDRGWRRGSWRGGRTQPDTVGRGPLGQERQRPDSLDWAANMVVHATLEDFDTLVIGEVEE